MKHSLLVWSLFGVALCLYLPFLNNPFLYDDYHSVVWNPALHSWDRVLDIWTDPGLFSSDPQKAMYRPLLLFSYLLNGLVDKIALVYRAGNLLLHLATGGMMYLLTQWLVSARGAKWALALFLFHPVFSEPVFYISSRSESLMALCAGAALWMYVRNRWGWTVLFSGLAMLSKETAVVLPAMFLLYEFAIGQLPKRKIPPLEYYGEGVDSKGLFIPYNRYKRVLLYVLPSALLAAGYVALSWHWNLLAGAGSRAGRDGWTQLWTQLAGLRQYALALLWPETWGLEGTLAGEVGPTLVGGLSLLLVGVGSWWAWQKKGIWLFLWGAFWLALLPTLVVPLNILTADRRLYWPGMFLCIGAGAMMATLERKMRWTMVGGGILIAALATLTFQRGLLWQEPARLWAQTAAQTPSYRALMNYGTELARAGDYHLAVVEFKRAVTAAGSSSDRAQALGNLGSVYFSAGKLDTSFVCYVQSIQADSLQADTWANLGVLWTEMGKKSPTDEDRRVRWMGAEAYLRHALQLNYQHYQAHLGLANLLEATGRPEDAAAERRLIAGLEPDQVLVPYKEGKK